MKFTGKFRFVFILGGLLALLLAAGCSALPIGGEETAEPTPVPVVAPSDIITTEGRLVPADEIWLSFEQPGLVAEVLVAEGDSVAAGDVLARLGSTEPLQAAVVAAELEVLAAEQALTTLDEQSVLAAAQARENLLQAERAVLEARQALDDLDTPEYQDDIDAAWETVLEEEQNLEDAEEAFADVEELSEDNARRQQAEDDLDDAQRAYDDAVREYDRLQSDLEQARAAVTLAEAAEADARRESENRQNGPDPDELALAQARLDTARAQLEAAQAALARIELTAPIDGTVVELNLVEDQPVNAFMRSIQLADFSTWFVETTDLNEIDVVRIDTGQPVIVIPDALPDQELTGTVERVLDGYQERAGDIVYTVRIRLDESDPDLRWGMTAAVEFERR